MLSYGATIVLKHSLYWEYLNIFYDLSNTLPSGGQKNSESLIGSPTVPACYGNIFCPCWSEEREESEEWLAGLENLHWTKPSLHLATLAPVMWADEIFYNHLSAPLAGLEREELWVIEIGFYL